MSKISDFYLDGIKDKCECGCEDIVIETTRYLFVKRKDNDIVEEQEGDEEDVRVTCRDCDKEMEEK